MEEAKTKKQEKKAELMRLSTLSLDFPIQILTGAVTMHKYA